MCYEDEAGVSLADATTLTGEVGDSYTTTPQTITGYHVVTTPSNASCTFSAEPQTVTYVYAKDADPQGESVNVTYVDETGKALAESVQLTGKVGEVYTAKAATIVGYRVVQVPKNATGTFANHAQSVTYVYDKVNPTVPSDPIETSGGQLVPQNKDTLPTLAGAGIKEQAQTVSQGGIDPVSNPALPTTVVAPTGMKAVLTLPGLGDTGTKAVHTGVILCFLAGGWLWLRRR